MLQKKIEKIYIFGDPQKPDIRNEKKGGTNDSLICKDEAMRGVVGMTSDKPVVI